MLFSISFYQMNFLKMCSLLIFEKNDIHIVKLR